MADRFKVMGQSAEIAQLDVRISLVASRRETLLKEYDASTGEARDVAWEVLEDASENLRRLNTQRAEMVRGMLYG